VSTPRATWSCDDLLISDLRTYQLRVDGELAVLVVGVLHLLVGHELDGSVGDAQHAGHKAAVQASHSLLLVDLAQGVDHALVLGTARGIALQAKTRLHHPDGVGQQQGEGSGLRSGQHVHRGTQWHGGVASLDERLDGVVAKRNITNVYYCYLCLYARRSTYNMKYRPQEEPDPQTLGVTPL